MLRTVLKGIAALAFVSVAVGVQQAQAGWHHHRNMGSCGSSGGSWGSYGSGGSWGSSGGSWGSSGGSWGSSGGWYSGSGSWGSCGGSWGSSGGSWGSGGAYQPAAPGGAAPAAPAPSNVPAPAGAPPAPADAAPAPGTSTFHPTYGPARASATLAVKVPADAKVFINDRATSSTGSEREYVSRDLQVGARYNYDVRVEFVVDGQPVTETKTVQLAAGQTGNVDFTQATAAVQTAAQSDARTTLIVRVPDDAKLYLSGHETQATGPVREFSTTKLPAGSEWSTYQIRAVVERDGQQQISEQTVSLKAGESRDVTMDFGGQATDTVASKTAR